MIKIRKGVKDAKQTNAIKKKRWQLYKGMLTNRKHKRNSGLKQTEITPKNK